MISVIVPAYNSEKDISRCINSIIGQSEHDFELLVIDDGSTDRTGEICDKFAEIDSRITVLHKTNGGVSSARNEGLKYANGEWISFIDSDDFVKEHYLRNLLSHTSPSIDLVISYAEIWSRNSVKIEKYPSKLLSDHNFDSIFTENDMHWHTSPWSKLYRRSVLEKNQLQFCEGMHIGEDALFLFSFLLLSSGTYISSDTDYCYFAENSNSLTKRVNSFDSELLSYNNLKSIVDCLIKEKEISNITALNNLNWLLGSYQRRVLNALYHNQIGKKQRMDILKSFNWKYYTQHIIRCSRKEKLLIFLLKNKLITTYDCLRAIAVKI